ncbi:MAG: hypothetical protein QF415_09055 [Candidatus Undinarchaeales archaeon]|jgi:hypothetical protein|nr:hypothetical protein [Candidatus Undinarchaeales archaeon]MDP7493239.1 hypothetical protein [Candidatus Undinarchaeales archaeon]
MAGVDRRERQGFISLAIFIVIAYGVLEVATINQARSARATIDLEERAAINLLRYHKTALEIGVVDGGFAAIGAWSGVPGELFGHSVVDLPLMLNNRYDTMNLGTNCPNDFQSIVDAAREQYPPLIDGPGDDDWKGEVAARLRSMPRLRLRFEPSDNAPAADPDEPAPEVEGDPEPVLTLEEIDIGQYNSYAPPVGYNIGCCEMELPDVNVDYAVNMSKLATYAREAGKACGPARSLCAAVELGMCILSDHLTLGPYGIPRGHAFEEFCEIDGGGGGEGGEEGAEPPDPRDILRRAFGIHISNTCSRYTDPENDEFIEGFFAVDEDTGLTYPQSWYGLYSGVQEPEEAEATPCGACSHGETDYDDLYPVDTCYPCAYSLAIDGNDPDTFGAAEGVVMRSRCRFQTIVENGLSSLLPTTMYDGEIELLGEDGSMVTKLPVHLGVGDEYLSSGDTVCDYHLADFDVWAFYNIACRMEANDFYPTDYHQVNLADGSTISLAEILAEDLPDQRGIHNFTTIMHKWATDDAYTDAGYHTLTRCPVDDECFLRVLRVYPLIRHAMRTCNGKRCCP